MKPWYISKLTGLGVIQTLIGSLGLLAVYLEKGDFSPASFVILFSGILTVILRVWFTETKLY